MQRKSQPLLLANCWQQIITPLSSALLLLLCVTFTSHSFAETNARGIEIEFLLDDLIDEEITDTTKPAVDQQALLELKPSQALAPANNNLWLRIQNGYAMPEITSPHTAKYESLYASKPEYVAKMMSRSQKYLFYVVEEVEKRGMPMEIALLPMIESAYNPKALSRSKALGIWQFMPATGKYFGLQQNWWVDHRRDVTAATEAALDYLEKLHGMFGSWDLALAAYNAGEGTVGRAIAKNHKAGLATNYQSLSLPLETRHYVPKLQAIKNIVNNPEQYGLYIDPIPNEAYFAEVDAPSQIDAKLAAKLAEISDKEFTLLNPSFNRPIVASRNNAHKLLLPASSVDRFQNNLDNHDKSLISWKVYKGKRGERVSNIAKKFNINTSHLRKVNSLPRGSKLTRSLHLLVPSGKSKATKINVAKLANQKIYTKNKRAKSKRVTHKIRRGETLSTLAKRYGTNTRALMRMNRLKSSKIKIGQTLRVKGKRIRAKTKRI
ncbi:MAG: transglycosylase SLT domain-containing protein [Methylophilaceae bacterium]